jgi:hypothetical protein
MTGVGRLISEKSFRRLMRSSIRTGGATRKGVFAPVGNHQAFARLGELRVFPLTAELDLQRTAKRAERPLQTRRWAISIVFSDYCRTVGLTATIRFALRRFPPLAPQSAAVRLVKSKQEQSIIDDGVSNSRRLAVAS